MVAQDGASLWNLICAIIFKIKSRRDKSSELDLFNEIFKIKSGRGKSLELNLFKNIQNQIRTGQVFGA